MAIEITRRELAALIAAPTLLAQTPTATAPLPQDAAAELQAARDQNRQTLDQLAKFPLPMNVEPATVFKP